MGGTLTFSERERWYSEIARDLEDMGFWDAALHIKSRIEKSRDVWAAQEIEKHGGLHVNRDDFIMKTKTAPFPSHDIVHVTPAPQITQPVIRPDQITS